MPSQFMQRFQALRANGDYEGILDLLPYARFLGVKFEREDDGKLLFTLPFDEKNLGNTAIKALHGGVIGGFLENSAFLDLLWHRESLEPPKIIDFSLDYLRSGRAETVYAQCSMTRQGKRVAHALVEAWQDNRAKPIAVARAHFLLI